MEHNSEEFKIIKRYQNKNLFVDFSLSSFIFFFCLFLFLCLLFFFLINALFYFRYWDNTKEGGGLQIAELFRVQREGESRLFSKFNSVEHRKLLWHGSSVAVFAAYVREVREVEVEREVRER